MEDKIKFEKKQKFNDENGTFEVTVSGVKSKDESEFTITKIEEV